MSGTEIQALATEDEAEQCALMMANTDPWVTLGRDYDGCLASVKNEKLERYVAIQGGQVSGVLLLNLMGALVGYIQTVCVAPGVRGQGLGTALVRFAEERIFPEMPNVFLCVSSFNASARRLYERLGYVAVGELPDYIRTGYSEILMRKSRGPIGGYLPSGERKLHTWEPGRE